jgi:hypothetical protein
LKPIREDATMKICTMKQSDISKCPFFILDPTHYNDNGTCRCTDPTHKEMKQWGYKWNRKLSKWSSYNAEPTINLKTAANVNKCIEYLPSRGYKEDIEQWKQDCKIFTKMITETEFKARFIETAPYFIEDKESRDIWKIIIKRNGKTISFRFGNSLQDTWDHKEPDLYSILAGMDLDYRTSDYTFEEYCDEYGFNADSISDKKGYERGVKQSQKLKKIFEELEVSSMPN